MIRFLILIIGVVAGLFAVVWIAQSSFLAQVIDRSPPEIQLVQEPPAFGSSAISFPVQVFDRGTGINALSASLKQGTKSVPCSLVTGRQEMVADGIVAAAYEVSCDAVVGALTPGPASVELSATDSSYWNNLAEKSFATEVDFTPPQMEILTQQHSVQAGGSELVLFRVQEPKLLSAGIKVGDLFFPASLARGLDPTFPEQSQIYASIFALPRKWTPTSLVRVFAEDEARNITEIPLRFRAQEHKPEMASISLSESFLSEKAEPLIPKYELFIRRYFPERVDDLLKTIPAAADREGRFRAVNEGFRGLLDEKLAQIFSVVSKDRLWQGAFIKPMPSAVSSTFGEERTFTFEGKPFGTSRHNGFDLASTERDIVRATNEGIVVLSEDFGLYGNTIVIDHGLGIFSLYGHLSVLQVKPGDRVLKGDIIARTGQTGFAGGDHLHFEIRVGEVPVSPIEWWDTHWYQDNVLGKIEAAKNRL